MSILPVPCDESFPEVPFSSPEWDEVDDHWTPAAAVLSYHRDQPLRFFELPMEEPLSADAPDAIVTTRPGYWDALGADGITPLPAIAGGSLDDIPPPYEPTPDDLAEHAEWSRRSDAGDALPGPRPSRYSPESLIAFRRAAWGV